MSLAKEAVDFKKNRRSKIASLFPLLSLLGLLTVFITYIYFKYGIVW